MKLIRDDILRMNYLDGKMPNQDFIRLDRLREVVLTLRSKAFTVDDKCGGLAVDLDHIDELFDEVMK